MFWNRKLDPELQEAIVEIKKDKANAERARSTANKLLDQVDGLIKVFAGISTINLKLDHAQPELQRYDVWLSTVLAKLKSGDFVDSSIASADKVCKAFEERFLEDSKDGGGDQPEGE